MEKQLIITKKEEVIKQNALKNRIQVLWELKAQEFIENESHDEIRKQERNEDALNWAFSKVPISLFPVVRSVIELQSDSSVEEALEVLSRHHILSAPVRNVDVADSSGWMEKYMGMVDFSAIVFYILGAAEKTPVKATSPSGKMRPELSAGSLWLAGDFLRAVKDSGLAKKKRISDICGTFRWGPFIPVSGEDTLLTLLLMVSKYGVKSVPVVEMGNPSVQNIITQSSIVNLLNECDGLPWFENVANKTLEQLGLPIMDYEHLVKVDEETPILEAFQKMISHWIGGVAVVRKGTSQLLANISARDIRFLVANPDAFPRHREVRVKDFLNFIQTPRGTTDEEYPIVIPPVVCQAKETLRTVIQRFQLCHVHRLYTVDQSGGVTGVVTLTDIIGTFVYEPPNYFGDFFATWGSSLSSPI